MSHVQTIAQIAAEIIVGIILGWAAREFNFLHLGTKYDAGAESIERWGAGQCELMADLYGRLAQEWRNRANKLKAPGK